MSSTESSGAAPAEATATTPAGDTAGQVTFGTSRGSGLARGKRSGGASAASTGTPVNPDYKPTAIEIVSAPREYTNPFAPATPEPAPQAETPAPAVTPAAEAPAPVVVPAAVAATAPAPAVKELFPLDTPAAPASAAPEEKAELNILPPERQKTTPAQTWESEGFKPAREPRGDRPRREDRFGGERREGGERRDEQGNRFRSERPKDAALPAREQPSPYVSKPAAEAPKKSGGFFGWVKSLFGGKTEEKTSENQGGEHRHGGRDGHRHHRHRGGRGRDRHRHGSQGDQPQAGGEGQPGGENRGEFRGEGRGEYRGEGRGEFRGGDRRRRRGGRGRGHFRGDRREGGGERGGAPEGN